MDWRRIMIGLIASIAVALFIAYRAHRRRDTKQLTYEELKREHSVLSFWLIFVGFATLLVAPHLNWSLFDDPWTGTLYGVCLLSVYHVSRWTAIWWVHSRSGKERQVSQP